mgnify:CR=1 FL=1
MTDIGFAKNYTNLYEIDVTPDADAPTYVRVAAGIDSVSWSGNESIAQDAYYDGDGMASSEVTGGQVVGTFEGDRKYGDPAQDYVAGLLLDYSGRHTNFKWTASNGDVLEGGVTIANIQPQSGGPNEKTGFGFEVHYNGMPEFVKGDANTFPESIDVKALTLATGETAPLGAKALPATAAPALVYGVRDDDIATVDAEGNVTCVAEGETEVSVKSAVKPMVRTVVKVTVSAPAARAAKAS